MVESNRFSAPTPSAPRAYLGVQYARAAAALGVLGFHAAQRAGMDFAAGARGVDLFFVISGFIMWTISARERRTPSRFLWARIERIVPLYWLATLFMIAAAFAGLFPTLRQELTWPHVLLSLAFIPHFAPGSGQIWPVLVPGWTLVFEMFFYLVFAAGLVFSQRVQLGLLTGLFTALVAAGLVFKPSDALGLTITNPLVLEFVAGVWLAVLLRGGRGGRGLPPLFALSAVALGLTVLLIVPFWGGLAERLSCLVGAVLCIAGVVSLDLRGATPNLRALRFLGDASYSTYLWHGVAVSAAAVLGGRLGLSPWAVILVAVFGGLLAGAVSYLLIERPLAGLIRARRIAVASRRPSRSETLQGTAAQIDRGPGPHGLQ